jgi:hypothetical protein
VPQLARIAGRFRRMIFVESLTRHGGGGINEGHLDTGLDTNPLNDIET